MSRQQLLVVGAGGAGRETVELVRTINEAGPSWELVGFLDDDPTRWNSEVDGVRVLGPTESIGRFPQALLVITVGNPRNFFSRKRIVTRLGLATERFATLVHPLASLPPSTQCGAGVVAMAGVVVTSSVTIGNHVLIMPGVTLTHDDRVDDFASLGAGVRLAGGVHVREGAYLGAGSLFRERCEVGAWSLVGMGAVVLGDIPPGEVWAGVPARRLRALDVPSDLTESSGMYQVAPHDHHV